MTSTHRTQRLHDAPAGPALPGPAGIGASEPAAGAAGTANPAVPATARPDSVPDDRRLRELIAGLCRGEASAMRELYEATSRRLYGLALHILGVPAAAEDALLEVYVQVWKQAARYDGSHGPVLAWLSMLTRTRSIDAYRVRARRMRRETVLDESDERLYATEPDPLDCSMGSERTLRLRLAVTSLPREQRRAIEAAFFRGLTHTEVAELLDQPLGTVKTRIRTGLATLRRELGPTQEGMP